MKFSISFKYQNASFKNKETKETISYETKAAEGNSFVFDNVDEDVVIGILKGVKDKKSSGVFGNDDFRTSFISTIAKNKCKELYDKIESGEWKIEDIAVGNITIKDLEFTRPTMNARETLTVESKRKVESSDEPERTKCYYISKPDGDPLDSVQGLESGYYHTEDEAELAVKEWMDKNQIDDFKYRIMSTIDDVCQSDFINN